MDSYLIYRCLIVSLILIFVFNTSYLLKLPSATSVKSVKSV